MLSLQNIFKNNPSEKLIIDAYCHHSNTFLVLDNEISTFKNYKQYTNADSEEITTFADTILNGLKMQKSALNLTFEKYLTFKLISPLPDELIAVIGHLFFISVGNEPNAYLDFWEALYRQGKTGKDLLTYTNPYNFC